MRIYLECECCGEEGAESDERGMFSDGQPLICGCDGSVSIDDIAGVAYVDPLDCPCEERREMRRAALLRFRGGL